jgi:hypothetical protein
MLAAIELLKAPAGNISSTSTSASGVTSSTASSASGSSEHEVDGVQEQIEQLVVDDSEEQVSSGGQDVQEGSTLVALTTEVQAACPRLQSSVALLRYTWLMLIMLQPICHE